MIERMFGSSHYALLYVFAGLCGSTASLWWNPSVHGAGAQVKYITRWERSVLAEDTLNLRGGLVREYYGLRHLA